jgi:hypothetical protein
MPTSKSTWVLSFRIFYIISTILRSKCMYTSTASMCYILQKIKNTWVCVRSKQQETLLQHEMPHLLPDKAWESDGGKVAYCCFLWARKFHNLCAQIRRLDSTKVLLIAFPVARILRLTHPINKVAQVLSNSK